MMFLSGHYLWVSLVVSSTIFVFEVLVCDTASTAISLYKDMCLSSRAVSEAKK